MSHRVEDLTGRGARVLLPCIGLALLFFLCAIHSTLATLPITLFLVLAYAVFVFTAKWSMVWVISSLGVGLLLYSPFLWLFVEAAKLSHRNIGTDFYPRTSFGLQQWLIQGKLMLSQIAIGINRYGLYLVVVLGIVMWFCIGPRCGREQPRLRKIVLFAVGTSAAILGIEFFHEAINDAKRTIPLLRGWNVVRFTDFVSFSLVTLFAWMLDRSLLRLGKGDLTPNERSVLRWAIVATGVLGGIQIAYSANQLRAVPIDIYPQNLLLYGYLCLYAVVTTVLLVLLYHRTGQAALAFKGDGSGRSSPWCVALIILAVSLLTSVQAYRSGLVMPQGIDVKADAAPIMTYAQRYAVPDEVLAMKRLDGGEGRIVDLTRPLSAGTWMVGSEITMLPLSGLRVLSGYSNLYPAWYALLIHVGVNGKSGSPWNIIQIEDTGRTNLEVLPLLNVQYVLAGHQTVLPRYRPAVRFESSGKTLYRVESGNWLGPAFVSQNFRCFAGDEEALRAIHEASLPELSAQAILTLSDPASVPFCRGGSDGFVQTIPSLIRSTRGQDRVRIEVENGPGGILTLSDTYYPGWKVLVNGIEQPLLRTYTALRGVAIGPGRQSVEFRYMPRTYYLLLRLSIGCLVALVLVAAVVWIREQRAERARTASR